MVGPAGLWWLLLCGNSRGWATDGSRRERWGTSGDRALTAAEAYTGWSGWAPPGLFQPQAGQAAVVQEVGAEWTWEAGEPGPHAQDSTVASTNLATTLHVLPLLHRAVWHCAQHLEWSRWWDFKLELVVISFIYKGTSQRSQDFVVNLLHNQTLMPTHNCFKPRKDTNSLQRPELPNNLLTIFSKQGEVGLSRPKQVRLQSVPEGQDNVFEMHGMQLQKQCH